MKQPTLQEIRNLATITVRASKTGCSYGYLVNTLAADHPTFDRTSIVRTVSSLAKVPGITKTLAPDGTGSVYRWEEPGGPMSQREPIAQSAEGRNAFGSFGPMTATPLAPFPALVPGEKLHRAEDTIHDLHAEIVSLKRERDDARAGNDPTAVGDLLRRLSAWVDRKRDNGIRMISTGEADAWIAAECKAMGIPVPEYKIRPKATPKPPECPYEGVARAKKAAAS